jgi:predicted GIY-YIG superfamily endonuclease
MRVRVDQAPFVPEWYQNGHFDPAKRTKELSKQLKLTADQQSQMLDTLESTKSQLEAVRSDRSLSRKARNCKLALIRQAFERPDQRIFGEETRMRNWRGYGRTLTISTGHR